MRVNLLIMTGVCAVQCALNSTVYIPQSNRVSTSQSSKYIKPRAPQCLSTRPNWDSHTPFPKASVYSTHPGTKGVGDARLRVGGGGGAEFGRQKSLSLLPTLCST
jgi:hypothetical protein